MAIDILSLITAIGVPAGGGIIAYVGRSIKKGQQDIKDDIKSNHDDLDSKIATNHSLLDRRLTFVEAENRTFMSKDELERKFDHDRNGRATIEQASRHLIDKSDAERKSEIRENGEAIIRLRESVAKLEQNDTYLSKEVSELKVNMGKGFEKLEGKMDEQGKCLAEINKKLP